MTGESVPGEGPGAAIEVWRAIKRYQTARAMVEALRGVSLSVPEGEFLVIMGPSGCGKSTLLHVIGALDTPDRGEVVIEGRKLSELSRAQLALLRRRRVGFVFQAYNLLPALTLAENVALPAVLEGIPEKRYRPRVDELLARVRLTERRDQLPSELSGGEQQRAAIARALMNSPAILLADEPTGNLDRSSGSDVMRLLRELNAEGQTTVVVTHDQEIAAFADRVVLMRDGLLVDEARLDGPEKASTVLARLLHLEA